ncbi:MAG: hypothetical protein FWH55_08075 [Oscillospiraceae bacterium]|nr:hypothetical protein [Oscillospiraceae bacterium]
MIVDEFLFSCKCLENCWGGCYHYLEPWIGCEHNCVYCFARHKSEVVSILGQCNSSFESPTVFIEPTSLTKQIHEYLLKGEVKTLKLSRFTDFFTPKFVSSGLSHEILRVICESRVERAIITTKGVPDERIISLMKRYRHKISFNMAIRPFASKEIEPNVPSIFERVEAASQVHQEGIQTTIHMDPLIIGFDDQPESLAEFLVLLKSKSLERIMFSFLLLTEEIVENIRRIVGSSFADEIISNYDLSKMRGISTTQTELAYFTLHPEILTRSANNLAAILRELNFQYALCALKNKGYLSDLCSKTSICRGDFYA